jgi:hypothetical protein
LFLSPGGLKRSGVLQDLTSIVTRVVAFAVTHRVLTVGVLAFGVLALYDMGKVPALGQRLTNALRPHTPRLAFWGVYIGGAFITGRTLAGGGL